MIVLSPSPSASTWEMKHEIRRRAQREPNLRPLKNKNLERANLLLGNMDSGLKMC
jgi:hypothetical protein